MAQNTPSVELDTTRLFGFAQVLRVTGHRGSSNAAHLHGKRGESSNGMQGRVLSRIGEPVIGMQGRVLSRIGEPVIGTQGRALDAIRRR